MAHTTWAWDGYSLRRLRLARGLSLEAVALHIGRSAASVTGYELGRAAPPLSVAVALAEALGVEVTDLMRRERGPVRVG